MRWCILVPLLGKTLAAGPTTLDKQEECVIGVATENLTFCLQSATDWEHEPPLLPHQIPYSAWEPIFERTEQEPLPRAGRIVVVMTTIPDRLPYIQTTINSIKQQSYTPDKIYLSLPDVFARDGTSYGQLPPNLATEELLEVYRCKTDFATITSIMCVLHLETNPFTYIVIVDDDAVYHPQLVENLLRTQIHRQPGCAIGQNGHLEEAETNPYDGTTIGPFLTQSYGVIYQRRMFDRRVFGHGYMTGAERECLHHGDLWLGAHLALKGIKRVGLNDQFGLMFLDYSNFSNSLERGGNPRCPPKNSSGSSNEHCARICNSKLLSVLGKTLWEVRPRRVAVLLLSDPLDAGPALRRVMSADAVIFILYGLAAHNLWSEVIDKQSFTVGAETWLANWLLTGDAHDRHIRHSLLYVYYMAATWEGHETVVNGIHLALAGREHWTPDSHDAGAVGAAPTLEFALVEGNMTADAVRSRALCLLGELEKQRETILFFAPAYSAQSLDHFDQLTTCAGGDSQICCVRAEAISIAVQALRHGSSICGGLLGNTTAFEDVHFIEW